MYSAWDFILQRCLKTLRKAVKEMAAQSNYRTHRLHCFMLNDASEIRHYFDPISQYLYNESTRRPKPVAHGRPRQLQKHQSELTRCKSMWKCRFCTLCFPCPYSSGTTRLPLLVGNGKLSHSHHRPESAAFKGKWCFLTAGNNSIPKWHPFKLLLYNLQPSSSTSRIHLSIS